MYVIQMYNPISSHTSSYISLAFIWMQQHPENLVYLQEHMMANRVGMPTFLDVFPVSEKATDLSPERALFVDIGAGYGQQAIAFKQ